jgi:vacuolar-type H+-ATPase subunit I/STV1
MNRALVSTIFVAFWLGAALLTVAVVAPGAFAVLPTRALAGDMVGRVLPVVFWGAIAVPALVLALDPSARRHGASVVPAIFAVLCAVGALAVVNPRIAALRAVAVVPIDQLAPNDLRRTLFGLLHFVSVILLGAAMLALLVLLVSRARAAIPGAPPSGDAR